MLGKEEAPFLAYIIISVKFVTQTIPLRKCLLIVSLISTLKTNRWLGWLTTWNGLLSLTIYGLSIGGVNETYIAQKNKCCKRGNYLLAY